MTFLTLDIGMAAVESVFYDIDIDNITKENADKEISIHHVKVLNFHAQMTTKAFCLGRPTQLSPSLVGAGSLVQFSHFVIPNGKLDFFFFHNQPSCPITETDYFCYVFLAISKGNGCIFY